MAGRCRSANRLLAGATGRAILGIAAFSQDSACTLAGRDGLPGTQRRTGVGPLRRTALAGLASPRNASEHGLCVFTHRASPGKKTSGATLTTLPQIRAQLQVRLIQLAGQCPWCKTRFDNTA